MKKKLMKKSGSKKFIFQGTAKKSRKDTKKILEKKSRETQESESEERNNGQNTCRGPIIKCSTHFQRTMMRHTIQIKRENVLLENLSSSSSSLLCGLRFDFFLVILLRLLLNIWRLVVLSSFFFFWVHHLDRGLISLVWDLKIVC